MYRQKNKKAQATMLAVSGKEVLLLIQLAEFVTDAALQIINAVTAESEKTLCAHLAPS